MQRRVTLEPVVDPRDGVGDCTVGREIRSSVDFGTEQDAYRVWITVSVGVRRRRP